MNISFSEMKQPPILYPDEIRDFRFEKWKKNCAYKDTQCFDHHRHYHQRRDYSRDDGRDYSRDDGRDYRRDDRRDYRRDDRRDYRRDRYHDYRYDHRDRSRSRDRNDERRRHKGTFLHFIAFSSSDKYFL
jgi:hypothetical protein